ncbi:MAG: hypothetical protein U1D25_02475 [Hydrogenophaga sp.]|uniref:hypothetical protein n=1 Tax=Hydrogenophaga sp. TaxID=1904254 RepID=UPI00274B74ED|nr:hypothetical protein [Hydrogenophaga sp.]MDP2417332.1 hypothetical protein [Hydrogenophaga sp.]MDZ4186962.1 hypothetical protein [Hydrogenophaga sp.]
MERPTVADRVHARTHPTAGPWARGLLLAALSGSPAWAEPVVAQPPTPLVEQRPLASALHLPPRVVGPHAPRAHFGQSEPSREARHVADWVVDSGDNGGMPFVVVDKVDARVFVFDARGHLQGAASALLGLAIGDEAVPGIGQRKLSSIRPEERTTSAGRFVATQDRNLQGKEILWVDYDAAISLHPVITGHATERRAQRLDSPSPLDNRISYGCINVPVQFYKDVVSPAFRATDGIVYVLPETRSAREVFGSYDVADGEQRQAVR